MLRTCVMHLGLALRESKAVGVTSNVSAAGWV